MDKPWQGKQMWIWELQNCLGGDVAAIVSKAKDLGLSGLIVKAWDGASYWSQIEKIIGPAHAAGLLVAGWGYSYGTNIPGEVAAMEKAIKAGADWLIIDAEVEYENVSGRVRAISLFNALAASPAGNATIGFSSFAFPESHPGFPWDVFAGHCQVNLAQIYWGEFKLSPDAALARCLSQNAKYGLPVAPVGQCYGTITPAEITAFGAAAKTAGCSGLSFWSWQHAADTMFQAIKDINLGDQPSDWAKASWPKAVAKGVLDGTQPQGNVTREQLAVVLDKLKLL